MPLARTKAVFVSIQFILLRLLQFLFPLRSLLFHPLYLLLNAGNFENLIARLAFGSEDNTRMLSTLHLRLVAR